MSNPISEAIEDQALIKAIKEGETTPIVDEAEVQKILDNSQSPRDASQNPPDTKKR